MTIGDQDTNSSTSWYGCKVLPAVYENSKNNGSFSFYICRKIGPNNFFRAMLLTAEEAHKSLICWFLTSQTEAPFLSAEEATKTLLYWLLHHSENGSLPFAEETDHSLRQQILPTAHMRALSSHYSSLYLYYDLPTISKFSCFLHSELFSLPHPSLFISKFFCNILALSFSES